MNSRVLRITGGATVVVALLLLAVLDAAPRSWAQDQPGPEATFRVGTYDPQQVFNAYPGREQMMNQITEIQGEMQQAQEQQDEQRLIELQQQMQQQRDEAIEQFQLDVERTLPTVADEAQLHLIAIDVVYTRDGVEREDITHAVIEELGGDPEPTQPQFMVPE